jgi:hypothetical protein
LARHTAIQQEFPGLQVSKIADQLERIELAVLDRRVPSRRNQLVRDKPPAWEYLLFAEIVRAGRDSMETKWRDHELRLPRRTRVNLEAEDLTGFLSRASSRLGSIVEPISRVFDAQESAFGALGESGDPVRIEHFANWLTSAYEDLLDWESDVRSLDVPEEFEEAVELMAQTAERPLSQFRDFFAEIAAMPTMIERHLAKSDAEREEQPLLITTTLTVSLDNDVMTRAIQSLQLALGLDPDFTIED